MRGSSGLSHSQTPGEAEDLDGDAIYTVRAPPFLAKLAVTKGDKDTRLRMNGPSNGQTKQIKSWTTYLLAFLSVITRIGVS
jgi:hypothetical protein